MIAFVATPIGNLKDITLRALEELRAADVIFCEDTRHTVKLLSAYDIKKPLRACHKFNEHAAAEKIVALHGEGKRVCVVSDAGMPVVSDPGNTVCKDLRAAGVPYTVLPGANAALSALVLSAGCLPLHLCGLFARQGGRTPPSSGTLPKRPRDASLSQRPAGRRPRYRGDV